MSETISVSPITSLQTSSERRAYFEKEIKEYRHWIEASGPHSHHGKFYRRQVAELTNKLRSVVTDPNTVGWDDMVTFTRLVPGEHMSESIT